MALAKSTMYPGTKLPLEALGLGYGPPPPKPKAMPKKTAPCLDLRAARLAARKQLERDKAKYKKAGAVEERIFPKPARFKTCAEAVKASRGAPLRSPSRRPTSRARRRADWEREQVSISEEASQSSDLQKQIEEHLTKDTGSGSRQGDSDEGEKWGSWTPVTHLKRWQKFNKQEVAKPPLS